MDKLEKGFQITMAGERAIIGKDFHILDDKSSLTFVTDDPYDFRTFLTMSEDQKILLTYDEGSIRATSIFIEITSPPCIAFCKMIESPILDLIRKFYLSKSIPAAEFEKFLYTMRKYYDVNGKVLYDQVKHLTIKKVTKLEKISDNQGNFHYCVTRTGDKEDMEPTPQILFIVPVFLGIGNEIKIAFDVHLEYREIEGGVAISYSLVNPFFEEELRAEKRKIVKEQLQGVSYPVLLGTANINKATSEWQFKDNGIE